MTGVALRNLAIQATSGGHGIHFKGVQNSVIDSCTIASAFVNGIFLETGGANLVMNNAVLNTANQHAIAVQGSSDNVIVGNTISGAKLEGILVTADPSGERSWRNRLERNTISGYGIDGITLLDGSSSNYVGLNTAVSTAYHPLTKPNPDPISGTGIWVNGGSNGNYLFGNDVSGAPENGIDVLAASSTLIQGNSIHGNNHGGLWIANVQFATNANVPVPQDTVIQGNNIFFNTNNQQVILQGAINVEVAYNHLSGAQSGTLAGSNTGGIRINEGGDAARGVVGSSGVSVFENTITDVSNRAYVYGTTTNTVFFRNRFLNGAAGAGRQGVTYSFPPAGVQWHAGALLGGNHWNEFGAAGANPDAAHPYNAFVGNADGGPYVDWLPLPIGRPGHAIRAVQRQDNRADRRVGPGGWYEEDHSLDRARLRARGPLLRIAGRECPDRSTVSECRTLLLDRAGRGVPAGLLRSGRVPQFRWGAGRGDWQQPAVRHCCRGSRPAEPRPGLPCLGWRYGQGRVETNSIDRCCEYLHQVRFRRRKLWSPRMSAARFATLLCPLQSGAPARSRFEFKMLAIPAGRTRSTDISR